MTKIIKYYLNKASYFAIDQKGKRTDIDINYWEGGFKVSRKNKRLEKYALKLLKNKHRVNFVHKIQEL